MDKDRNFVITLRIKNEITMHDYSFRKGEALLYNHYKYYHDTRILRPFIEIQLPFNPITFEYPRVVEISEDHFYYSEKSKKSLVFMSNYSYFSFVSTFSLKTKHDPVYFTYQRGAEKILKEIRENSNLCDVLNINYDLEIRKFEIFNTPNGEMISYKEKV